MRSDAQNIQAICKAMDQHDRNCSAKLLAILMNPFEVDRLGWDEIRGVPVQPDDKIPTGRFRLVCDGIHDRSSDSTEKSAPDEVKIGAPERHEELDPAEPILV